MEATLHREQEHLDVKEIERKSFQVSGKLRGISLKAACVQKKKQCKKTTEMVIHYKTGQIIVRLEALFTLYNK